MNRLLSMLVLLLVAHIGFAQQSVTLHPILNEYNLGFEKIDPANQFPLGWSASSKKTGYSVYADSLIKHGGNRSLRFEKTDTANKVDYAMTLQNIPAKYQGKEIEVRAFIKSENVSKFINLILRIEDEDQDILQFASLQNQKINGTKDWKLYSLKLPLSENAKTFNVWAMLSGSGKMWVDDVQILIDGKDISVAKIKPDYNPNAPANPSYGSDKEQSGRLKLKDADIYYESYGQGEPLLLLHGNGQSIKAFKYQIKTLSKDFRVIAVDTRGQGRSTDLSTGPLSYTLFARDMKTLLDSLHISRTNVLGWSDGGNTGLIMAYQYPGLVTKLAVMGANLNPGTDAVSEDILKEVHKAIDRIKDNPDAASKKQVRLFTMLLTEPNISVDNLKHIKAPVLVMAGEKDMILLKHTKFIASNIPKAELTIFKGATHYAPVEVPTEFNAEVLRFLQEQ